MNYEKHYFQLMLKAIKRQEDNPTWADNIYTEQHHWYPRSLYPEYAKSSWNLITLTAREHFISHWLLHRAMPDNKQMSIAFWAMVNGFSTAKKENKHYIPSRAFQTAKEAFSKAMTGKVHSEETRLKISKGISGANNPKAKLANIYCSKTNAVVASNVVIRAWCRGKNYHHSHLNQTAIADRTKPHNWENNLLHSQGLYARYLTDNEGKPHPVKPFVLSKLGNIYNSKTDELIAENVEVGKWAIANSYNRATLAATARADRTKPSTGKNPHQHKGIYAVYV